MTVRTLRNQRNIPKVQRSQTLKGMYWFGRLSAGSMYNVMSYCVLDRARRNTYVLQATTPASRCNVSLEGLDHTGAESEKLKMIEKMSA